MKKAIIILLLSFACTVHAKLYVGNGYMASFTHFGKVQNTCTTIMWINFGVGAGQTCPPFLGYYERQANDTVFLSVLHDKRGIWPLVGCTQIDTIEYKLSEPGINYINVSYNEILYDSVDWNLSDTLFNLFDSTFVLNPTSVRHLSNNNTIRIFPNPTSDFINIETSTASLESIILCDQMGRTVLKQALNGTKGHIPLHDLPPGLYQARGFLKDGSQLTQTILCN